MYNLTIRGQKLITNKEIVGFLDRGIELSVHIAFLVSIGFLTGLSYQLTKVPNAEMVAFIYHNQWISFSIKDIIHSSLLSICIILILWITISFTNKHKLTQNTALFSPLLLIGVLFFISPRSQIIVGFLPFFSLVGYEYYKSYLNKHTDFKITQPIIIGIIILVMTLVVGPLSAENTFKYAFVLIVSSVFTITIRGLVNTTGIKFIINDKLLNVVVCLAAIYLFIYIFITNTNNLDNLAYPWYDLGLFDHAISTGINGLIHNGPLAEQFRRHSSPILLLLIPFYQLFQHINVLILARATLFALAVIPLVKIALHITNSKLVALTAILIYLLMPITYYQFLEYPYGFHETVFVIPLFLFSYYFLIKNKAVPYLISITLLVLVKEEFILTAMILTLIAVMKHKHYRLGLLTIPVTGITLLLSNYLITKLTGIELSSGLFTERYGQFGSTTREIITNIIFNPIYTILSSLTNEKLSYLITAFTPVMFISLFAGWEILLLIPGLAVTILAFLPIHYDVHLHYSTVLAAGICITTIVGLKNLVRVTGDKTVPIFVITNIILLALLTGQLPLIPKPSNSILPNVAKQMLENVPSGASILTSENLATNFARHGGIRPYSFGGGPFDPKTLTNYDYIFVNTREATHPLNSGRDIVALLQPSVENNIINVVDYRAGILLAKPNYSANVNDLQTPNELYKYRTFYISNMQHQTKTSGVANPTQDGAAFVATGPYIYLPNGSYKASFLIKTLYSNQNPNTPIFTVDINSAGAGGVIASRSITVADVTLKGKFVAYDLLFESQGQNDFEFRIYYYGSGKVEASTIDITPYE